MLKSEGCLHLLRVKFGYETQWSGVLELSRDGENVRRAVQ